VADSQIFNDFYAVDTGDIFWSSPMDRGWAVKVQVALKVVDQVGVLQFQEWDYKNKKKLSFMQISHSKNTNKNQTYINFAKFRACWRRRRWRWRWRWWGCLSWWHQSELVVVQTNVTTTRIALVLHMNEYANW